MRHYWRVTGLDEGMPIEPYVTDTDWGQPYECVTEHYLDKCRYCEEISRAKYYYELRQEQKKLKETLL